MVKKKKWLKIFHFESDPDSLLDVEISTLINKVSSYSLSHRAGLTWEELVQRMLHFLQQTGRLWLGMIVSFWKQSIINIEY